ncbi:MAG: right-handed parallel beta-helix repeat-containing protein [Alphaproteobacteria bacterium]
MEAGDTIRIDAGVYRDCAVWRAPRLTIEGVGGVAHIRDVSCEGKGLWVFCNGPVKIRNVRFSGAQVPRRNGAGIRWEGRGWLVVENTRFDGNQMGILTHNRRISRLFVSNSRFEGNGACEKFCGHAIYAGYIGELRVQGSTFRNHAFGHHIKSRALVSTIVGNRISDGPTGTASYAINLPNSGTADIRHNVIQKGRLTDNIHCAVCIGEEIRPRGPEYRASSAANPSRGITVTQNTFRNDSGSPETALVWNRGPHPVRLQANTMTGPGVKYFAGPKPDEKPKSAGH